MEFNLHELELLILAIAAGMMIVQTILGAFGYSFRTIAQGVKRTINRLVTRPERKKAKALKKENKKIEAFAKKNGYTVEQVRQAVAQEKAKREQEAADKAHAKLMDKLIK